VGVVVDLSRINKLIDSKLLLVFDFDGVIVDSIDVKTEAFAALYEEYGNGVVHQIRKHHLNNGGMSRFEKIQFYHNKIINEELDDDKLNALCDKFSDIVVDKVINAPEIPGATKFLEQCKTRGKCCIVNSATPLNELRYIINNRKISGCFFDLYGSPISKTENLTSILKKNKFSVEQSVFFGDAVNDFEAANIVGMDFIGIGKGIYNLLDRTPGDWFMLDDFTQIHPNAP